jgi:ethanolamine utilization cobalamin adenosyltransferase
VYINAGKLVVFVKHNRCWVILRGKLLQDIAEVVFLQIKLGQNFSPIFSCLNLVLNLSHQVYRFFAV